MVKRQIFAPPDLEAGCLQLLNHEIRTPLYGVTSMVGLLAKTPLDDTQKTYVHYLQLSADHLTAVLTNLLDFFALQTGEFPLHLRPFTLKDTVESTVRSLTASAQVKGLKLELVLDPHLPEWVWGDPECLATILRHLVDHALQFTHRGSVHVRAEGLQHTDRTIAGRLAVPDTGIGISPADQTRIFAAFHPVDSSLGRQYGGMGLGLAIGQRLSERMGGRLDVISQEGVGSTFSLEVLLTIPDALEPNRRAPSTPCIGQGQRARRRKPLGAKSCHGTRFRHPARPLPQPSRYRRCNTRSGGLSLLASNPVLRTRGKAGPS